MAKMTKEPGETGPLSQPCQREPAQSQNIGNGSKRCSDSIRAVDVALAYASAGAYVLPLRRGGKLPHKMLGSDFKMTPHPRFIGSVDEDRIREWWSVDPWANVGVITGMVSGLLVVDLDHATPSAAMQQVFDAVGELPETVTVETASGKRHLWFRLNEPLPTKTRWLEDVDAEADGGYIVAPPSRIVRPEAHSPSFSDPPTRSYEVGEPSVSFSSYRFLTTGRLAEAPSWLLADIRSRPGRSTTARGSGDGSSSLPSTGWFLENGFGQQGQRNTYAYALACRLYSQSHGGDDRVVAILYRVWQKTTQTTDPFTWDEVDDARRSAKRFWESGRAERREQAAMAKALLNRWGSS